MSKPRKTLEEHALAGLDKNHSRYQNYTKSSELPTAIDKGTEIKCPKKFGKQTKKAWNSIVPGLTLLGVLNEQDMPVLDSMFRAYEEYSKTYALLLKFDEENPEWYLDDALTNRRNRINNLVIRNLEAFTKISYRFGLTPIERTKLQIPNLEEKVDDPLEMIING